MSDHREHRFSKSDGPTYPDELWIKKTLAEEPLEDDGFSQMIRQRLGQKRRKHRTIRALTWVGAWVGALLTGAFLTTFGLPSPDVLPAGNQTLESHHILALALLSLGLISALWLDTESFGLEL